MLSLLCCAKFQLKSKNRCYKLKNHTSRMLAPGEKSKNPILTAKLYIVREWGPKNRSNLQNSTLASDQKLRTKIQKIDINCKIAHGWSFGVNSATQKGGLSHHRSWWAVLRHPLRLFSNRITTLTSNVLLLKNSAGFGTFFNKTHLKIKTTLTEKKIKDT